MSWGAPQQSPSTNTKQTTKAGRVETTKLWIDRCKRPRAWWWWWLGFVGLCNFNGQVSRVVFIITLVHSVIHLFWSVTHSITISDYTLSTLALWRWMSQWNINLFSSFTGILIFFTYIDGSSLVCTYDLTNSIIIYNNCTRRQKWLRFLICTLLEKNMYTDQLIHDIGVGWRWREALFNHFFRIPSAVDCNCWMHCMILYTARQHPNKNATAVERAFSSYIFLWYTLVRISKKT